LISIFILMSCQKPIQYIELPSIISDGMVLQQNTEISLWGNSSPDTKIQINSSWGQRYTAKSGDDGKWMVKIKTPLAGGPYELAFQTSDTNIVLKDILIGEVWLCSGQSNMEMPLSGWAIDTINNSAAEIAAANYPDIRLFTVPRNVSPTPITNCNAEWMVCTPENITNFSATAYFFGRKIHQDLKVPVGLIHSSWGGSPAESWTKKEYLLGIPSYAEKVSYLDSIKGEYDSLMKWMGILQTIEPPTGSQSYSSVALEDQEYVDPEFDDSSWLAMSLPQFWEKASLPDYDGIVWFRKEFDMPASFKGKELTLHLGAIDDMDATYVNGVKVGEIMEPGFWKKSRDYTIPANTLKEGRNVIAVKVVDNTGGGGIYDQEGIYIASVVNAKNKISLDGNWKYLPVAELIKGKLYVFGKTENTFAQRPVLSQTLSANTPTALYNAMINPLVPYTIQGVIWYQGESNVGRAFEYKSLFPALIESWRSAWGQGDFPFYYVQIAPWFNNEKERSPWTELREAQLMTLKVPNTGMAVTSDIGNPNNIHPSNKQDVGLRLALWALAKTYGKDSIVYSGPLYNKIDIQGNKAVISFSYAESGLIAKGGPLNYFEIAGEDQKYYPAKAEIKGQTVEVWSDKVSIPAAVRFGWEDIAETNLFNGAGLPASPFCTDNWKRLSE